MAKTPKASPETLAELEERLDAAADGLRDVGAQKMFGCHAIMARGTIFGLVWKEGRIGVKLRDEHDYAALMAEKGAAPWQAGPMTMSNWVLVPPALAESKAKLAKWVERAHAQALAAPAAPKTAKKKTGKKAKAAATADKPARSAGKKTMKKKAGGAVKAKKTVKKKTRAKRA